VCHCLNGPARRVVLMRVQSFSLALLERTEHLMPAWNPVMRNNKQTVSFVLDVSASFRRQRDQNGSYTASAVLMTELCMANKIIKQSVSLTCLFTNAINHLYHTGLMAWETWVSRFPSRPFPPCFRKKNFWR